MKTAVLAATVATASAAATLEGSTYAAGFVEHVSKYGVKVSNGKEFSERLAVYTKNSALIDAHNKAGHSYTLAHNQFSHLTFEEFEAMYLSEPAPRKEGSRFVNAFEGVEASDSVDWSTTDFVTDVKNQGSCGSCWAFSTTGGLEGAYYLKNQEQVSFSEQQLVSCDTDYGDMGCNGGLMDNAFQYIAANGLCKEDDYPYTSSSGSAASCDSSCTPVSGTKGITYTDVATTEDALAAAVTQQPISVAVDADYHWQFYSGGVMTDVSGTSLDHGVLAVGYGTDDSEGDYWKVKNSWGGSWGEEGYIRIAKGSGNPCGITSAASYPTLA